MFTLENFLYVYNKLNIMINKSNIKFVFSEIIDIDMIFY